VLLFPFHCWGILPVLVQQCFLCRVPRPLCPASRFTVGQLFPLQHPVHCWATPLPVSLLVATLGPGPCLPHKREYSWFLGRTKVYRTVIPESEKPTVIRQVNRVQDKPFSPRKRVVKGPSLPSPTVKRVFGRRELAQQWNGSLGEKEASLRRGSLNSTHRREAYCAVYTRYTPREAYRRVTHLQTSSREAYREVYTRVCLSGCIR